MSAEWKKEKNFQTKRAINNHKIWIAIKKNEEEKVGTLSYNVFRKAQKVRVYVLGWSVREHDIKSSDGNLNL